MFRLLFELSYTIYIALRHKTLEFFDVELEFFDVDIAIGCCIVEPMTEIQKNIILIGIFTSIIVGGVIGASMHMDTVRAKEKQARIDTSDPVKIAMKQKEQEELVKKQEAVKNEAKKYVGNHDVFIDSCSMTRNGNLSVNVINTGNKQIANIEFKIEIYSNIGRLLEVRKLKTSDRYTYYYNGSTHFGGIGAGSSQEMGLNFVPQYKGVSHGSFEVSIVNVELENI